VRHVVIGDQQLRVSVRPAQNQAGAGTRPDRTPLLLISGIGARLELLEPFVAHLDPAVEVIRFDPPASAARRCPAARTASPGSAG